MTRKALPRGAFRLRMRPTDAGTEGMLLTAHQALPHGDFRMPLPPARDPVAGDEDARTRHTDRRTERTT
ncbi:hypothetical protein ACFSUJ_21535 [Streptomyces lusitanus]|uniref:Uncharacterized protein n=1 Tax=Streptomyces lusitanus TaxID=68232 RepID=A0ABU3JYW7_9ACTN|nr:hypothetical protein [Streptomyces lusitanus]